MSKLVSNLKLLNNLESIILSSKNICS